MTLIEHDAEVNPEIPPAQLHYIRNLADKHTQYTRFFDALLIPRPSHAAFFRDLKGFRNLPTTIEVLAACNPENITVSKEQRKENYRDATRRYLGSRFAHPWCRKAMAGMGNSSAGGWWGAEWAAAGRKLSKEQLEQEDKLHKTLLPIWVTFRGKMFPGDDIVDQWWEDRKLEMSTLPPASAAESVDTESESTTLQTEEPTDSELRMAKGRSGVGASADPDTDDDEDGMEEIQQQGATVATGLLRLAAAGMLISSMPKMQQWKLKRELKREMKKRLR